jgi:hypothetical protein
LQQFGQRGHGASRPTDHNDLVTVWRHRHLGCF